MLRCYLLIYALSIVSSVNNFSNILIRVSSLSWLTSYRLKVSYSSEPGLTNRLRGLPSMVAAILRYPLEFVEMVRLRNMRVLLSVNYESLLVGVR